MKALSTHALLVCVVRQIAYLKAFAGDSHERQTSCLCMLERWLLETESVATDLHSCLNQLYAAEVVTDDAVFEKWFETPNFSR